MNDFYTTTDSGNPITLGDNRRYFTLTVNSEYYDHNVNTMRKLFKTSLSGMSVSAPWIL